MERAPLESDTSSLVVNIKVGFELFLLVGTELRKKKKNRRIFFYMKLKF